MLNVLLVDDEPGALNAMRHLVEWETYGFAIAGEANNGNQALEMLAHAHYSLVITDIRMPGLNGLELIHAIREISNVPVIVLSGYEEFEYAKACVRLGVKEYLLKPVIKQDLMRVLMNVQHEQKNEHLREKQLHLGIPAIREQLLKNWVRGYLRPDGVTEQFKFLNIQMDRYDRIGCMMVEVEFPDLTDAYWTESEIRVGWFAVRNVIEEVLGSKGYVFEESPERFGIVLFGESEAFSLSEMVGMAQSIRNFTAQYAKLAVSIGVSSVANTLDIVELYRSAEHMLERKFLIGAESIILSEQFTGTHVKYEGIEPHWMQSVLEAVKQGNRSVVHALLWHQMSELIDMHTPKERIQSLIIELFVHLFQFLQEKAREEEDIFHEGMTDYRSIMEYRTIEKLFEYTEQKCLSIMDYVAKSPSSPPLRMVQQVKKIIHEEYGSNLSLKSIAEQMFINPAYLGRIFKSYEGISFNDYLMRIRMEQAKKLLETTEKKVYEIALEVGYRQLDWFYKKFKDYTGKSTSDFRSL
ncbi:response regulator [Paenibacillus sp. LHD-38]|uniref:response regulator n=1 Tax=Paenibacillus sp. LHD-38 TaxID=3072143 RepID=UPI00280FD477|nr:response regulator [Paenibacillus sp. LHD-38]MDQ8737108.1 response regulator [Paenibacillus sp. LHD-38]